MINAAYHKTEHHVFPGTTRTQRHDVTKLLKGMTVVEVNGEIAACVHITIAPPNAHFGLLAADVGRHGEGFGSLLIGYAEERGRAAGCTTMRLEVVKEADRIPYYERRGYRQTVEHLGQEWNGGADWGADIEWHMVDMEKAL
jgi:GNAT superfamily N-acetyltransferase